MCGEIQREVEGANAKDRADWEAACDTKATLAGRRKVEWDRLADHPLRLFCRESEGQRTTVNLCARVADRLPRFGREECGELVPARANPCSSLAQDFGALPCAKRAHAFESRLGTNHGALHLFGARKEGAPHHVAVIRRTDLMRVRRLLPGAGDQDLLRLHEPSLAECHCRFRCCAA